MLKNLFRKPTSKSPTWLQLQWYATVTAAVGVLLVLASFGIGYAQIWTDDHNLKDKLGSTCGVTAFLTIVVLAVAAVLFLVSNDTQNNARR